MGKTLATGLVLLGMTGIFGKNAYAQTTDTSNILIHKEIEYIVAKSDSVFTQNKFISNPEAATQNFSFYDDECKAAYLDFVPKYLKQKIKEFENTKHNIKQEYNEKAAKLKSQYEAKEKTLNSKITNLQDAKLVEKNEELKKKLEESNEGYKIIEKKLTECEKKIK